MAKIDLTFFSATLKRSIKVVAIIPNDTTDENNMYCVPANKKFKTLYLLHGMFGCCDDWNDYTRISRYARESGLAVIMPEGLNNYYADIYDGEENYGTFIGKELVEYTRSLLPLSSKRKDTFIGGLSMGGYGALRNGFEYADTFSHIIALSAVTGICDVPYSKITLINSEKMFGPYSKAKKSKYNLKWLIENTPKEKWPKVYMAIGTEDSLYDMNQDFRKFLSDKQVPVQYVEEKGGHEWDFWDRQIKQAIATLPIK